MMTNYVENKNPKECTHSVKKIIKVDAEFETQCLFCDTKLEVV